MMTGINEVIKGADKNSTGQTRSSTDEDDNTTGEQRRGSCYSEAKDAVFTSPPKIHKRILKIDDNMEPAEINETR